MTKDGREIDRALHDAVLAEVGQERFDLWFGEGVALRLAGGELCVLAVNRFALERVRSSFEDTLRRAAQAVTGHSVIVRFELRQETASEGEQAAGAGSGQSLRRSGRVTDGRPPTTADRNQRSAPRPDGGAIPDVAGRGPMAHHTEAGTRAGAGARQQRDHEDGSARAGGCFAQRRFRHLQSFVVGDSNRIAYTAAEMVTQRPGQMSPLFLYGPSGSGKTHLLEGIWSAARRQARGPRVLYLSAEQFTTMFLEALQGKGLPSFRYKYRHIDLLLIDDVQFFLGKRATIVEFQHTIDAMLREHRQLVLAADRSPVQLARLGTEVTARLSGGLVCGVEPADRETRLEILRQRAASMQLDIHADLLAHIAEQMDGDARRLTGILNRLQASSRAFRRPIDVTLVDEALADLGDAARRVVKLKDIDRAVCDVFGLEKKSLQSQRKTRSVSQPRALAMWLARKYTRAAYSEIGDYFGSRSHSTVISANRRVRNWLDQRHPVHLVQGQCDVREAVRRIELQIRTG